MSGRKAGAGPADESDDQRQANISDDQPRADVDQVDWADHESPRRPRSDSLELGALVGAVPSARLHARHVLREWGLEQISDSAELVVSELVTNAVQATLHAGIDDPVRLSLLADDVSVLVVVSDAIPDPPRPRRPDTAEEKGRGLIVVEHLSDWWDWKPAGGGKLVRALVGAP